MSAALIFADYDAGDPRRWVALAFSRAILAIFVWQELGPRPLRKVHAGLLLVTAAVAALMFFGANLTAIIILLFIVAGGARIDPTVTRKVVAELARMAPPARWMPG